MFYVKGQWQRCFFVSMVLVLLCVSSSWAMVEQLTLEQLSQKSDSVIHGIITQTTSQWNARKDMIYTTVVVRIEEYIKGNGANRDMTFVIPGGEVDGKGLIVSDMPSCKVNEEVVLFLNTGNYAILQLQAVNKITGLSQGKFCVQTDETTGKKYVTTYAGELVHAVAYGKITTQDADELSAQNMSTAALSLDEFKKIIKTMI